MTIKIRQRARQSRSRSRSRPRSQSRDGTSENESAPIDQLGVLILTSSLSIVGVFFSFKVVTLLNSITITQKATNENVCIGEATNQIVPPVSHIRRQIVPPMSHPYGGRCGYPVGRGASRALNAGTNVPKPYS
jgi:hypothetical protein